jgi:hypothetical protein
VEHGVLSKKLPKEIIIVIILRSQRQNSLGRTGHTTRAVSGGLGMVHASIVNDGRQFNSANNIVLNAQLCK